MGYNEIKCQVCGGVLNENLLIRELYSTQMIDYKCQASVHSFIN